MGQSVVVGTKQVLTRMDLRLQTAMARAEETKWRRERAIASFGKADLGWAHAFFSAGIARQQPSSSCPPDPSAAPAVEDLRWGERPSRLLLGREPTRPPLPEVFPVGISDGRRAFRQPLPLFQGHRA